MILEIGTGKGDMTANLCHYSQRHALVYSIDICAEMGNPIPEAQRRSRELQPRREVGAHTNSFGDGHKATIVLCDSRRLDWAYIPWADFVFIDGNHEYEWVRHDSEQAYRHLQPGGVIVWHDYGNAEGTKQAVDEFAGRVGSVFHVEGTWIAFWTIATTAP